MVFQNGAVFSKILVAHDCVEHVCYYTAVPNIISKSQVFQN